MTDASTKKPLTVSGVETDWPYIKLPMSQLEEVRALFDRNQILYSVDTYAISWDGGPYMATITLDRGTDPWPIQAVLDEVR